jgi:sulfite reductase (NADPH) flavoprotein alpha-component
MVPVIPDSAPFTAEQRAWLNGYLAGLFSRGPVNPVATAAAKPAAPQLTPLTILFGSQTGGAESLAKRAAKEAGKRGFAATVLDMGSIDAGKLANEKNVLVITSTFGEGEPPDNAKALHAQLAAATTPLPTIRYSVCGLGDTNYVHFCKCGQDFDAFFEKLGATRVSPRVDCDLDFETKFSAWLNDSLTALGSEVGRIVPNAPSESEVGRGLRSAPAGSGVPALPATNSETPSGHSRSKPFSALIVTTRGLNGEGSAKQVNHIEFALEGSGLSYEAGDALGVYPHNCPDLVNEVLGVLGCDGEEAVPSPDGATTSLRRALLELYDLGKPTPELLTLFGSGGGGGTAIALHHVIDVLATRVDVKLAPADFVRTLKRLQPRLYSISSSPKAHAGHVHLTVGAVRYDVGARLRKGVCSTFLADRVVPGETRAGIFVHSNKAFRPPADGNTPMIMVGPGTGIAPFRAFLHERRATSAKGRNWLLFGDQKSSTDFLYREELETFRADGSLTRLDLAWSRDQQQKVYVQNRMIEHAAELYAWLEAGAHFYVCGDASRMAKDVDAALHRVVETAGGKSAAQAAEYVQALRTAKRYQRDVY